MDSLPRTNRRAILVICFQRDLFVETARLVYAAIQPMAISVCAVILKFPHPLAKVFQLNANLISRHPESAARFFGGWPGKHCASYLSENISVGLAGLFGALLMVMFPKQGIPIWISPKHS